MTRNEERTQPSPEENLPWQLPPRLAVAVYRAKQILPVGSMNRRMFPYFQASGSPRTSSHPSGQPSQMTAHGWKGSFR